MKCPHCRALIHVDWYEEPMIRALPQARVNWTWRYRNATCPGCQKDIVELLGPQDVKHAVQGGKPIKLWHRAFPRTPNRGPVPVEVPQNIAGDYAEACNVLPASAKASAALSRRCLQTILRDHGYKARDLAAEIELLLNDADPKKAIPNALRDTIDGIRNFGNFSAHPVTDQTTLQIIDVEPEEAEWCLEIVEAMFEHFYVRPAQAAAKKAALNAKLAAAGKPPAK